MQELVSAPTLPLLGLRSGASRSGTGVAERRLGDTGLLSDSKPAPRLSIVIPCLNEAENIEECVHRARHTLAANRISRRDHRRGQRLRRRQRPARRHPAGALVVHEPERGYGSAYMAGLAVARGRYILMADADLTYDFADPSSVRLRARGRRRHCGRQPDEEHPPRGCSPLHRQPVAVGLPLPAVPDRCRRRPLRDASLPARRAAQARPADHWDGVRLPHGDPGSQGAPRGPLASSRIEYHPREGESKLSSFRDGWRYLPVSCYCTLRITCSSSPERSWPRSGRWWSSRGHRPPGGVFGRAWDIHALIAGALLAIVGTQIVALEICAYAYATYFMAERDRWFDRMRARYTLEHGLVLGGGLFFSGAAIGVLLL